MSQVLKAKMKQLTRLRVETEENTASYRAMANHMIDKMESRRLAQEADTHEHETQVAEQVAAINAQTEEIERREELIHKLRYAVA